MDTTTEEDEQKPPPQSTSLFPISTAATAVGAAASQWLRNASFAADLSAVNDAVSSRYNADILKAVTEEEADEEEREEPKKPSYEVLESSESERERRKIKKKKKKKKRKRVEEDETVSFRYGARKSGVRAWESSETKPSKDYYFDSRGDQDNLEFGCLYRMDVARYKLYDSSRESEHSCQAYSRSNHRGLLTEGELDVDALDSKLKSNGRYWSAKFLALEHQRNSKRVRILAPENPIQSMSDDFIPIADESGDRGSLYGTSVIEESWEDEVLRRTKEFNKMTREHPHNVTVWLEFAGFQDKVASMQPQKGARLQTIEKKISILEKAVELNPDDEDLILSLLKTYQGRDSMDALIGRWEKVLMQHSESCKLWREFLRLVHGDFSMFKVSELRKLYAHAIQALSAACRKRNRQLQPAADPTSDAALIELELGMVDVFLNLCRFEWQAGYQELATALFQAEIEYALFCPSLQLTEPGKLRLFEHFWSGNGARIGEDGALGWSTWLEKEEENRQKIVAQMSANEDEHGGWTGWFIPSSEDKEDLEKMADTDVGFTDIKDEAEDENVKQEEDDETLLRMLGIDVDAEATGEVKDTATWVRWAEEESARDRDQWMPLHANSGEHHSVETMDADGEDQLSRVVLFEDVSDYLFSLSSTEARLSFLLQFIDFFDGQIPHCICTNTLSWSEKVLSLEELPASILQYLRRVDYALSTTESGSSILSLEILLRRPDNAAKRISVMKFLRNAILLCLTAFPRNYKLEEALLVAEEQIAMGMNTSQFTATPCQALAKRLLKSDRQDVLLCGIYARREAAFGNIEHARKVFDMALASINGLPRETQSFAAPILFFWFSEMELSNNPNGQSMSRVLHILSCLGNGISYTPFKAQPSSVQILRARQGFKDQINTVRSFWACGNIDDSSVALICSAALFEELTTGWETGVKVISDALAMVLPERKGQSYQIEFLFNFYVTVLQKHHREAKLSKMLHSVLSGLQIYPTNPGLFASLVELGHLYSVPNKLRWILDDFCQKKTSVIVWLFALLFELGRGDSRHRIRRLFERALVNETLRSTPLLWRCYIAYEVDVAANLSAARRIFFRAIHACPWSKKLWLDGFKKLNTILTAKELSDLQEVMRDKELNLRTDIYEILLQDEHHPHS